MTQLDIVIKKPYVYRPVPTVREFGMNMYTLLYVKWITNKDPLSSTGNSASCYMAAWMEGEFGGEWIRVCERPSPFTAHLKVLQPSSSARPEYKIKV